jgi:electron transport complex protein RnfG
MSDGTQPSVPGLTPPVRLVATLGGFGALSGLLIVVVFALTQPAIQAYRAAVLAAAINEVLGEPDRYDSLYVIDGAITSVVPDGVDPAQLETLYLGYRNGQPVGFAIRAAGPGFQDTISMIVGYDPTRAQLLGMKVLESKETPGLGDKIFKDLAFVAEFAGASPPLVGVKPGSETGRRGEVVLITGATISSRAIIKAINRALERMDPMLAAYQRGQAP